MTKRTSHYRSVADLKPNSPIEEVHTHLPSG